MPNRWVAALGTSVLLTGPLFSQTPPCGTVITTPGTAITFDSDMICPEGYSTGLTIEADDVTINGAGFRIVIMEPDYHFLEAVWVKNARGLTLSDLEVITTGDFGLRLTDVSGSLVSNVHVTADGGAIYLDRTRSTTVSHSTFQAQRAMYVGCEVFQNTIRDSVLSGSDHGVWVACTSSDPRENRRRNAYIGNVISGSDFGINVNEELAALVCNNVIEGSRIGIDVNSFNPSSGTIVFGNQIQATAEWGVRIENQREILVAENSVTGGTADGLVLENAPETLAFTTTSSTMLDFR